MEKSKTGSQCLVKTPIQSSIEECYWTGVEVYHRICPSVKRCWQTFTYTADNRMLLVRSREAESHGVPDDSGFGQYTPFCSCGILDDKCQDEVFEILTDGLVERTFTGHHSLFVAVGPPGSGKTYTMAGLGKSKETKGLLPRVARLLVREAEARTDEFNTIITVSFLEFAANSETLYDLNTGKPVSQKGAQPDRIEITVSKEEEILAKLATNYNKRSKTIKGGSHDRALIITFSLHLESKIFSNRFSYHPKILFAEVPGWRNDPPTTKLISDFALYLGGVKPPGLGRTASKFVSFLDRFWHQSLVRVICHYHGKKEDRKKSLAALTFCDALSHQRTHIALVQRVPNTENMLLYYKSEVKRLQRALNDCRREAGYHGTNWLSRRDAEQIENLCKQYLTGEIPVITLLALADPDQLLETLRFVAIRSVSFVRSSDGQIEIKKKDSRIAKKEVLKKEKKTDKKLVSASVKTPSGIGAPSYRSGILNEPELSNHKRTSDVKGTTPFQLSAKSKIVGDDKYQENNAFEISEMPKKSELWSEFFARYPELIKRLNFAQKSLDQAEEDRDISYDEFKDIRDELRKLKLDVDSARWKRKMEIGDNIDWLGRVVKSEEEKILGEQEQIKEDIYNQLKLRCYEAVRDFGAAHSQYIGIKSEIEQRFDEYCRTAYGNLALTLEVEEIKDSIPCWPNRSVGSKRALIDLPIDADTCTKKIEKYS